MAVANTPENTLYRIDGDSGQAVLFLLGRWDQAQRVPAAEQLGDALAERLGVANTGQVSGTVIIDGEALSSVHPRIAALVYALRENLAERDIAVEARNLPDRVSSLIDLAAPAPEAERHKRRQNRLARIGYSARLRLATVIDIAGLVGHAASLTPDLVSGRSQTRWRDFVDLIRETGASSLPVVTVVNLLIGAVLGFVGAVQLATFGAGLYLADLVGIATAREMAAIMTAFIMAGRVGATFAAHLATMEANEEIDALRMIGVSPFEFLALPRLAALTLMMPLLYLYAAALGILGGLIVAHIVLGTPPASFLERLQDAVAVRHFVIGFVKSICFGVLIALASCYIGLRAGRNAAEVGRAATRTVVVCIIGIILIDAVFALCTNALGI